MRVGERLLQQRKGRVIICSAGKAHQCQTILCGDFALAAFPRVEVMPHNAIVGFLILSVKVQQGNVLGVQVIALRQKGGVFLHTRKALGIRCVGCLVQLIQLEKDAGIGFVHGKGCLHGFAGARCIVQLIVVDQSQIAPYGGQGDIFRTAFPQGLCLLPAGAVQQQTAKIISCILPAVGNRILQCGDIFQTVGETVQARRAFGQRQFLFIAGKEIQVIVLQRLTGLGCRLQNMHSILIQAGGAVSERQFDVIVGIAAQQAGQLRFSLGSQQGHLIAAAVIQRVDFLRFAGKLQGLLGLPAQAQQCGF